MLWAWKPKAHSSLQLSVRPHTIGALIITYTVLGVPYSKYSITGPETLLKP